MALKSLSELRAIVSDPQLLHKWSVDISTWPSGVSNPPAGVPFMIKTVSEPKAKDTPAEVELGGFKLGYNGKQDRDGEVTAEFVDNTNGDVLTYFFITYSNAKQNYQSSNSIDLTSMTTPELICPLVKLSLYDPTGTKVVKTLTLINVLFQLESNGITLGQDVKVQEPGITFKYDSFIVQMGTGT